jgi:hypothetical protein
MLSFDVNLLIDRQVGIAYTSAAAANSGFWEPQRVDSALQDDL